MLKIFLTLLLSLVMTQGFAKELAEPLQSEQAFVFTTYVDDHNNIMFQWKIAPGYFLYQTKFNFTLSPASNIKLGKIEWPKNGLKKNYEGISYPIYADLLKVTVPLVGSFRGPIVLSITYQGCSIDGFCYAPIEKSLKVDLSKIKPLEDLTYDVTMSASAKPIVSDQNFATKIFVDHNIIIVMLSFLGLGLLLAFTPCVLPMIPILSGIIVGHRKTVSTMRGFNLSLFYVMGMAITYAIAGVMVALLGNSIQGLFQKAWVILLFSGIFILLSLSLFGLYDLQLPSRWHNHTTKISNRLQSGSYVGVFLMGCLSTLIVSPCVSAPLVGVLTYIAQSGNVVLGGTALLMLGIGMGIPLLLIGTSAAKWLPSAGHWMNLVKKLFGILMLGVAIWMISRVVSGRCVLLLWSLLAVGSGLYLGFFYKVLHRGYAVIRVCGVLLLVYGIILMVGVALGKSNPFMPWGSWDKPMLDSLENPFFTVVKNEEQLEEHLNAAKQAEKIVILDFYAKWCVSCVVMDQHLFKNPKVQGALASFVRLRADVTKNNVEERALMKRYHVVAPPTILFFDSNGNELGSQRIVGEINETELLNNIDKVREQSRAK